MGVTSSASIAAAQSTTLRRPSTSRFFIAENLVIHDLPFLRDGTPSMVPFRKMTSKRNGSDHNFMTLVLFWANRK